MNTEKSTNWKLIVKWIAGVVSTITVSVATAIILDLDIFRKEDFVVPKPFGKDSLCSGHWIYREKDICDDKSKPIHPQVADGNKCGWDERTKMEQPDGYKSCRHISHGVERYQYNDVVEQNSGWRGGGRDQDWWCQEMKNGYQATKPNISIVWRDRTSSENSRHDIFNNYQYNYHCRVTAYWGPIYNLRESQACGPKDPIEVKYREPRTCIDYDKIIGYEQSQNTSCDYKKNLSEKQGSNTAFVYNLNNKNLLEDTTICTTCDEYAKNINQQAKCILENYTKLEADGILKRSPSVMTTIRNVSEKLVGSDRPLKRRLKKQLRDVILSP